MAAGKKGCEIKRGGKEMTVINYHVNANKPLFILALQPFLGCPLAFMGCTILLLGLPVFAWISLFVAII